MLMIDSTVLYIPTAICNIDTPFLSGRIEALCVVNPVCDLIVGNVDGVHEPTNDNPDIHLANEVHSVYQSAQVW